MSSEDNGKSRKRKCVVAGVVKGAATAFVARGLGAVLRWLTGWDI